MEDLIQLFYQLTGENPVSVAELPIAGSNRKYLRLHSSNTTYIGVLGTIIAENSEIKYFDTTYIGANFKIIIPMSL